MLTRLRDGRRTPAAIVLLAACLLSLNVGVLACRRGDQGPGFRVEPVAFVRLPRTGGFLAYVDLIVTAREGIWVHIQDGYACNLVQWRRGGRWEGALMTWCDTGGYSRYAPADTLHSRTPMAPGDTIRIGLPIFFQKPPERMKREEFLKLIRWSPAVVFDSSKVVSWEKWQALDRY